MRTSFNAVSFASVKQTAPKQTQAQKEAQAEQQKSDYPIRSATQG